MLNVILGICGIIILILTAVVVYSDDKSPVNRWLGVFTAGTFIWLLSNLLTNLSTTNSRALLFARASLVGAAIVPAAFLMFCYHLTHNNVKIRSSTIITILVPVALLLITVPTKLNVISVSGHGTSFEPGISYGGLLILSAIYFTAGTVFLVRAYTNATPALKQQLIYILIGNALTLLPVALTSGLLPLLGNSAYASASPAFVLFFASFTSYAIVKHGLLDVRLIVARALAYGASLIILSTIYGTVVFGVARFVFDLHLSTFTQLFLSITTGLASLSFQKFQKIFDKLSSRVFFRESYDTQVFLDQFNKILVSTFEIGDLLRKSSEIIEINLKTSFCVFGIGDSGLSQATIYRFIGSENKSRFAAVEIAHLKSISSLFPDDLIVTKNLDDKYSKIKKSLESNDVDVWAKLSTSNKREGIGFLVLGPKKSGNPYSSQDLKVIEIVTNELVIAVQNALHTEEIEKFNITLQQKVDDATHKLRKSNEKLKALDETKDDFISMASHQLRTPLTSVKGYISMVLEEDAGTINDTQREMLGQAFFSSQRMVYLIADLLNVSRLKTGKFIIEPKPINLDVIVEQELKQLKETAASRSLTLDFVKPDNFPTMMLDETKTRQIIMNFVDNAIYYTPAGGHVMVKLVDKPDTVELRVEDNGIGVPKNEIPHLFTKFYRAGNARKARPDGTGLGLYMAKKVIIAQGGSLIFDTVEGKGSTFGFTLSKSMMADPPAEEPVAVAAEPKTATPVL